MRAEETLLTLIDEKLTGTVIDQLRRAIWQMLFEAYRAGFEDGKNEARKAQDENTGS